MSAEPQAAAYPEEVLRFERLISDVSHRFIDLPSDRIDSEIEAAQKLICNTLGFDRSTLAQYDPDTKEFVITHSWAAPGFQPIPIPRLTSRELPWIASRLVRREEVQFTRVSDLPDEAATDKETFGRLGPKSSAIFPLDVGGDVFGGLAFGAMRAEREWPALIVDRLRLVASVFAHALGRKRSHQLLAESRERIDLAVESAGLGVWTWDLQRDEIKASEQTTALLGLPRVAQFTRESFLNAVHPNDRAKCRASIDRAAQIPMQFKMEHDVIRSDGAVRWVVNHGRSYGDAAGKPVRMSGVVLDVTAHKVAEDRFRLAVEAFPTGMVLTDSQGTIVLANARTEQMFGYKREELIGQPIEMLVPERFRGNHPAHRAEFAARPSARPMGHGRDLYALRKDGSEFPVEIELNPIVADEGPLVLSAVVDITGRKKAEKEMEAAFAEIKGLKQQLERENVYLKKEVAVASIHREIVGQSEGIRQVLMKVDQVAPTDSAVLILGETGTGKELVAKAIHERSRRKARLMVKVNCAALPASLVESELFGREKGAFTGALTREIGRFELANDSTIFLDEIGELPLELQAKLLRVLQEGEFQRLGSPRTIRVDARLIVATSRNLTAAVKAGTFREDLYYRLNVFPIQVPSLRDRQDDIPMLTWHFLRELGGRMGRNVETIRAETMKAFQSYPWPGNVRELRNVIERYLIINTGPAFEAELPEIGAASSLVGSTVEEMERNHIRRVLESTRWRIRGQAGAAAILGLKPTTLESRMKKLGIVRQERSEMS